MEHENLLKFYGCDERLTMEGYKQYWMVLSYCPLGNLQCYLESLDAFLETKHSLYNKYTPIIINATEHTETREIIIVLSL
jgi:hypothetical protein